MKFTFLGTGGCPIATTERYGPAHVVETADARVLIDCGSGVSQQLVAAGIPGFGIDALVVTHYHTDHMIDFYQLIMSSWHQGRDRHWRVFATPKSIVNMKAQIVAWEDERSLRIEWERRQNHAGLEVEFHELSEGRLDIDGMNVEGVAVDHAPVVPAYGLVFEGEGSRIVFSGDTRPVDSIEQASRGADLLVHEVYMHSAVVANPGTRSPEMIKNVSDYHSFPAPIGEIAARSGVKALALTHVVPVNADRNVMIDEVRTTWDGPLIVGEDLMTVEPAKRRVRMPGIAFSY